MITGPTMGPAMLLTILMRWPSLIVLGAASVGGAIVSREFDEKYDLTEQIKAVYEDTKSKKIFVHAGLASGFSPQQDNINKSSVALVAATKPVVVPIINTPQSQPQSMQSADAQVNYSGIASLSPPGPIPNVTPAEAFSISVEKSHDLTQRYVVVKGDTLLKIVIKLGVPFQSRNEMIRSLFMENRSLFPQMDPDRLLEGMVLVVPPLVSSSLASLDGRK